MTGTVSVNFCVYFNGLYEYKKNYAMNYPLFILGDWPTQFYLRQTVYKFLYGQQTPDEQNLN